MAKQNPEVFLSHADRNKDAADSIAKWLESILPVQVFVSSSPPGTDFVNDITETIRNCKIAVLLATTESITRPWVHFEVGAIIAMKKPFHVLCAGDLKKTVLPAAFQRLQACDYDSDKDVKALLAACTKVLSIEPIKVPDILSKVSTRPKLEIRIEPPDPVGAFPERDEAVAKVATRMLEAAEPDSTISFLGIAHSDLFGTHPVMNAALRRALARGVNVKMIFLDPDSPAAARRQIHETGILRPIEEIRNKQKAAKDLSIRSGGKISYRTTSDLPCYLAFNDAEMIMHSYISTATGHSMPTIWLSSAQKAYQKAREHFERIWGNQTWVLFDLGNVLLNFDHGKISQGLLDYFPKDRQTPAQEQEIHDFFFLGSHARNNYLDRGRHDLGWLHGEFCRHFDVDIQLEQFQKIWTSIFSPDLNEVSLQLARDLKKQGIKIAVCSNTNHTHWDWCRDTYPLMTTLFDRCFLSFERKGIKADVGFFHAVAQDLGVLCEHIMLIDDREENCAAALATGFHAFLFDVNDSTESVSRIRAKLDALCW